MAVFLILTFVWIVRSKTVFFFPPHTAFQALGSDTRRFQYAAYTDSTKDEPIQRLGPNIKTYIWAWEPVDTDQIH